MDFERRMRGLEKNDGERQAMFDTRLTGLLQFQMPNKVPAVSDRSGIMQAGHL